MADIRPAHNDSAMSAPINIAAARREFLCHPCERKGKRNEPAGYCKDCMKYLCEACHSSHPSTKLTKHHVLFDWKTPTKSFRMPKIKLSKSVEDTCTTRCLEHSDRVLEYFCPQHDFLGCSLCMAREHNNCENIKFIPEITSGPEDGDDYRNYMKDLVSLMQRSQGALRELQEVRSRAELHGVNIVHQIRRHRRELDEALDGLVNDLVLQVDTAKTRDVDRIDDCMSKYESACREVERVISGLQGLHQSKQRCQLFVTMKHTNLQPIRNIVNNREEITCMTYKFHPNVEMSSLFKDVTFLGNVGETSSTETGLSSNIVREKVLEFENKSKRVDPFSQMPPKSPTSPGYTRQLQTTSLDDPDYVDDYFDAGDGKKVIMIGSDAIANGLSSDSDDDDDSSVDITFDYSGDIRVQSSTDFYPVSVTGSALLSDDNLVIVDTTNWSVKLVDTSRNEIVQDIHQHGCPWDVTTMNDSTIAVTLPILKRIDVYKYGPVFSSGGQDGLRMELCKDRDIYVRGHCYGIAHTNDKLIVSYAPDLLFKRGSVKVEILNIHGHVLKRISDGEDGDRMFIEPRYVAATPDARTIYISDWGDNSVTSISADGDVLALYEDSDLQRPGKPYVDSHGTILVGGDLPLAHRLSPGCERLDVVPLTAAGERGHKTISVSEERGVVYVGTRDSNVIRTYQIS